MYTKIAKRLISVICFLSLLVGCGKAFRYILVDDTSSYTRIMMHELYHSEENIDILFVGSSHAYRSVDPRIADDILGAYTFNAGTSAQWMDGSLALIREASGYHELEHVYVEIYYGIVDDNPFNERTNLTQTYVISDYMKPSLLKLQYLLEASSKEHYTNSFLLARRSWEKFFDSEYVQKLLAKKAEDSYRNYEWVRKKGQTEYYAGRGFVANERNVQPDHYWNSAAYGPIEVLQTITVDSDWHHYLQEIIDFCQKEGIGLTLFTAPMPEWTIAGKGNYDSFSDMVTQIADRNGVRYFDFNLCKEAYFDTADLSYFMDEDHLNTLGTDAFTRVFSSFFAGNIPEEDLFYGSLAEKLAAREPTVYGIAGPCLVEEEGLEYARIISTRESGIEYRLVATPDGENSRLIQDFSENKDFTLPAEEDGILTLSWRSAEDPEEVFSLELEY